MRNSVEMRKAGIITIFISLDSSLALSLAKVIALDNSKLFIFILFTRIYFRDVASPGKTQRADCVGVFRVTLQASEGSWHSLVCPGNTEAGWDFVPDRCCLEHKTNCLCHKTNKVWTNRRNPSFHHKNNMQGRGQGMEQNSSSFRTISILFLFEINILAQNHLSFKNSMHKHLRPQLRGILKYSEKRYTP